MYTNIFIERRGCVFRNFRIFPFLEKAMFFLFSSRKDVHFFVFVTQKRCGNLTFSDYGNLRKLPGISSFYMFSRIYAMRNDVILFSFRFFLLELYYQFLNFIRKERFNFFPKLFVVVQFLDYESIHFSFFFFFDQACAKMSLSLVVFPVLLFRVFK